MGWVFPPITPAELLEWAAFERVEGPILIHDRIETSVAIAAMTSAAPYTSSSRPTRLWDFLPHWDPTMPTPSRQSEEDIMQAIKSLAIKDHSKDEDQFYDDSGNVHPKPPTRSRVERQR